MKREEDAGFLSDFSSLPSFSHDSCVGDSLHLKARFGVGHSISVLSHHPEAVIEELCLKSPGFFFVSPFPPPLSLRGVPQCPLIPYCCRAGGALSERRPGGI